MEKQGNRRIELKDISALRLKCAGCKKEHSVPLDLKPVPYSLLKCPHCEKEWLPAIHNPDRNMIGTFADQWVNIKLLLEALPFTVYLEIAPDPASADKKQGKELLN
jgi:hypothetical protein